MICCSESCICTLFCSKEHDHSSFFKFLQMEQNHKNTDCYFFYYSKCSKVRNNFRLLTPLVEFRAGKWLESWKSLFLSYHVLRENLGEFEVRSAMLKPCCVTREPFSQNSRHMLEFEEKCLFSSSLPANFEIRFHFGPNLSIYRILPCFCEFWIY